MYNTPILTTTVSLYHPHYCLYCHYYYYYYYYYSPQKSRIVMEGVHPTLSNTIYVHPERIATMLLDYVVEV